MADAKKTTKQTTEKKTVAELRADLLTARQGLYTGTLQNPHAIKAARKALARQLTQDNNQKGAK